MNILMYYIESIHEDFAIDIINHISPMLVSNDRIEDALEIIYRKVFSPFYQTVFETDESSLQFKDPHIITAGRQAPRPSAPRIARACAESGARRGRGCEEQSAGRRGALEKSRRRRTEASARGAKLLRAEV